MNPIGYIPSSTFNPQVNRVMFEIIDP